MGAIYLHFQITKGGYKIARDEAYYEAEKKIKGG